MGKFIQNILILLRAIIEKSIKFGVNLHFCGHKVL